MGDNSYQRLDDGDVQVHGYPAGSDAAAASNTNQQLSQLATVQQIQVQSTTGAAGQNVQQEATKGVGAHETPHGKKDASTRPTSPISPTTTTTTPRASLVSSAFNLLANLMGSGMLAMPYALRHASLIGGFGIFASIAVLNGTTMWLLALCCEWSRTYTYGDLAQRALGRTFGQLVSWTMICYTFISCLSYVVLIGDFIPDALDALGPAPWGIESKDTLRLVCVIVVALVILLPLGLFRNLHSLRFTSGVSLLAIAFSVVLVIQEVARRYREGNVATDLNLASLDACTIRSMAIMNVAFCAHYNAPRFYFELDRRSPRRFALVLGLAMGLGLMLYGLMAICGYLSFGRETAGDILDNFSSTDGVAIGARIALAIGSSCSFPLCFHAVRTSVVQLAGIGWILDWEAAAAAVDKDKEKMNNEAERKVVESERVPAIPPVNVPNGVHLNSDPATVEVSIAASDMEDSSITASLLLSDDHERSLTAWFQRSYHGRVSAYVLLSCILLLMSVILGIVFQRIEVVVIYKGSIFGCAIVYLFPTLAFLAMRKQRKMKNRKTSSNSDTGKTSRYAMMRRSSAAGSSVNVSGSTIITDGLLDAARQPMLSLQEQRDAEQNQHGDVEQAERDSTDAEDSSFDDEDGSLEELDGAVDDVSQIHVVGYDSDGDGDAQPDLYGGDDGGDGVDLVLKTPSAHGHAGLGASSNIDFKVHPYPDQVLSSSSLAMTSAADPSSFAFSYTPSASVSGASASIYPALNSSAADVTAAETGTTLPTSSRSISTIVSFSHDGRAMRSSSPSSSVPGLNAMPPLPSPTSSSSSSSRLSHVLLSSRVVFVGVWCLLVWGVLVGAGSLTMNIIVQAGGFKHCQ